MCLWVLFVVISFLIISLQVYIYVHHLTRKIKDKEKDRGKTIKPRVCCRHL